MSRWKSAQSPRKGCSQCLIWSSLSTVLECVTAFNKRIRSQGFNEATKNNPETERTKWRGSLFKHVVVCNDHARYIEISVFFVFMPSLKFPQVGRAGMLGPEALTLSMSRNALGTVCEQLTRCGSASRHTPISICKRCECCGYQRRIKPHAKSKPQPNDNPAC